MAYLTILVSFLAFGTVFGVRLYDQCGGEGYRGSAQCDSGLQCLRRSKWFSSCQVSCPADWECKNTGQASAGAKPWDQCGGQGWRGATWCSQGYKCYARSVWYSQCRPDCPADWQCVGSIIPTTTSEPTVPSTTTAFTTRTTQANTDTPNFTIPSVFTDSSSETSSPGVVTEGITDTMITDRSSSSEEEVEIGSLEEGSQEETDSLEDEEEDYYLDEADGFYDGDNDVNTDDGEEEIDYDFDGMIFDSSDEKDIDGTGLSEEFPEDEEEEGFHRRYRRATTNPLTVTQLKAIMPKCAHPEYIDLINQAMDEGRIQLCYDRAAFLAQIAHESGQLNRFLEGSSGKQYEGNRKLGNTEPGDGPRYRGRGAIQITGRWNYGAAGKALKLKLLDNPDLVLEPEIAFRTSAWFWKTFRLSANATLGTEAGFKAVTRRINTGMSHYDDRIKYWKKAIQVLKCENGEEPEETVEPSLDPCEAKGGICQHVSECTDGYNIKNLCPGGTSNQCCVRDTLSTDLPETTESSSTSPICTVHGDEGQCLSRSAETCNGQFFPGYCKGLPKDIQCCIESEYGACEHQKIPGICKDKDTCTTGNVVAGECPNSANVIQCCLQEEVPKNSIALDEACSGYETAPTTKLEGSYSNKAKKTPGYYNVVPIQVEHLTHRAWAKGTYQQHDIMVDPRTACAFVKLRKAVQAAGFSPLTITSAFRTIERQRVLFRTEPPGNAARPGNSNHGYGKALDLNVVCKLANQKNQKPYWPPCTSHKLYIWLMKNAESFGFRRTVPHESWHYDYVR